MTTKQIYDISKGIAMKNVSVLKIVAMKRNTILLVKYEYDSLLAGFTR